MGVAYVDWTARDNVIEALKSKHLRQMNFSDGCYKARPHIAETGLHRDDEYTTTNLMELAQASCTCEMLDPEEMMIQAEEAAREEYEASLADDRAGEITDRSNEVVKEPEEPVELSLAEYFQQLFKITPGDNVDYDEQYHGVCGKMPKLRYGKSRIFGPARQAALLSA